MQFKKKSCFFIFIIVFGSLVSKGFPRCNIFSLERQDFSDLTQYCLRKFIMETVLVILTQCCKKMFLSWPVVLRQSSKPLSHVEGVLKTNWKNIATGIKKKNPTFCTHNFFLKASSLDHMGSM